MLVSACASEIPTTTELTAVGTTAHSSAAASRHMLRFDGGIPAGLADQVAAAGGTLQESLDGIGVAVVAGLDDAALGALGAAAVVPDEELDFLDGVVTGDAEEATASDEADSHASPATAFFFPRQWHHRAIKADVAWAAGKRGSASTTVGILDSGIDPTYPDLVGRIDAVRSKNYVNTVANNYLKNLVFPTLPAWIDMNGHGTHVASTVVSNGHTIAAVTQRTTLVAIRVLGHTGSGSTANVLAGIMYAADNGVDVLNASLGSAFLKKANPGFVSLINHAMNYAHDKGMTIVVSAGNDNWDLDHNGNGYSAYCNAPHVICVSATGPSAAVGVNGPWTNVDSRASYSNFGRSAVSVAAPGGTGPLPGNGGLVWAGCSRQILIVSPAQPTNVIPAPGTVFFHTCSAPANRNTSFTLGNGGTSMASPHVTGLAALLVEQVGKNPGQIANAIRKSADDLGANGTDPIYGKGRINVARALGLQ